MRPTRPRWTLRRRLVTVVVVLLATVAGVMGVASTLALRASLIGRIDQRLVAASTRASSIREDIDAEQSGGGASASPSASATSDPSAVAPDPAGCTADGDWPPAGWDSGSGSQEPRPPGLLGPQDIGTIVVSARCGHTIGGYYDDEGSYQKLTAEQIADLIATPADGSPRSVEVSGLGTYRVVAVRTGPESTDLSVDVTGLSTGDAATTVGRYIGVEVMVALAGLAVAGYLAMVLVRRELRPLNRVAATAARVAELPLDRGEVTLAERVPDADTDPSTEVGKVGSALNRMLGHVEEALTARHESETQVRQFVADASHELRTPLASIRGYAELVRRLPADLPDDALRAMSRVESESLRMTGLVEDMLLLARLDAGRDLDVSEVDLVGLAVDAVADAHAAGPDHVWRLDLGDAPDADAPDPTGDGAEGPPEDLPPALVTGDEHRLRQVLVNLLSNARVHTPPGTTVVLSVRRTGDQVVLQVRDDGPGIAEPLASHLFQRFTRGDASRNRAAGSTGLGLAIVHAVVTAHGGTIVADGTPGATTFTVTLPAVPDWVPDRVPD
ncbi:sensor histidine kinase [Cellulomonas hominis]